MNMINYYEATEADIASIIDLRIAFFIEFQGPEPQEAQDELRKELNKYFIHAMREKTCISWLAKDGEKSVGVGAIIVRHQPGNFKNLSGKVGYVINMYTVPDYRRKGISSTILDKLIATAKEMGITAFELHATKAGEPVYIKNGFKIHDEPTYRKFIE